MNKLKRMTILTAVFCALGINTYAKTNQFATTDKTLNEKNTLNRQINVTKKSDSGDTVIYSGSLSGYDGGCFEKVDFSNTAFMVVFEWDSGDTLYISPANGQASAPASVSAVPEQSDADLGNSALSGNICTNIALMYNNRYCENVIIPGQILTIPITVTNNSNSAAEIIPYIAKYDLSGRLLNVTKGNPINTAKNSSSTQFLTEEFESNTPCTAKIFLWENGSLAPVANSICMTAQNSDFYPDTFQNSIKVDISKPISGVINTDSDIDIIKFTPSETGLYALQTVGGSGTSYEIYDSGLTLLNSAAESSRNYILCSLTAGNDYYVRTNGSANASYEITAAAPSEIQTLVKNAGHTNALTSENNFNTYKFTPSAAGSYIITATGSNGVNAQLYNSSFEKLASGDVTDTSVSFRITADMAANQNYYIAVYPKSDSDLGTYSIYVEEPFDIISVE